MDAEHMVLAPAFKEKNVAVFCSTDDRFALYAGVLMGSIIEHASPEWNYDLIILEDGVSELKKEKIRRLAEGRPNVSIRLCCVAELMEGKKFPVEAGYSIAIWYRLFAATIFRHYEKIVYLDCDVAVLDDIAKLYHADMGDNWLAGCTDVGIVGMAQRPKLRQYYRDVIGYDDVTEYVNSGVLIFNISQFHQHKVEEACVEAALGNRFRHQDQDTLNYVCRGHIFLLDLGWNVLPPRVSRNNLPPEILKLWQEKAKRPSLVHFVGEKPWANPTTEYASLWWELARRSPLYEEVFHTNLVSLIRDVAMLSRNKWRYFWLNMLSKVTIGWLHQDIRAKKRNVKTRIERAKKILAS